MPIDPEKLKRLDAAIDNYFKQREQDKLNGTDDDDDDVEENMLYPLDAPPSGPFYHDGAQRKKDLFG